MSDEPRSPSSGYDETRTMHAALKVIRGSAHTESLHVRLFRREAETLGRLRHPNIGAIYGAGRLPDGRPYFAMELAGRRPAVRGRWGG